jgi:KDO2-lipid IV(A) lauroyltransferase
MKRLLHHTWTEFRYRMYLTGSFLTDKLPMRVNYAIATVIVDWVYFFMKRHAANTVSNMRRVLGEQADWQTVKRVARDSFRNYVKLAIDFLRVPHMTDRDIYRAAGIPSGLENIDGALAKGKGIVIITAHFGNWDLAGASLARLGYRLNAVADTFEPEKMDRLINGTRRKSGLNVIPVESPSSLKELFMALRRNEIVFLLIDEPQEEGGVPVSFFGETVNVPGGPAALALKTGAAVMTGYGYRNPGGTTFHSVAEHEIDYKPLLTGNKERDIQIITQEIVHRVEQVIRKHPDQWYMFREMWPRTAEHDAEVRKRRFWGGRRARDVGMAES